MSVILEADATGTLHLPPSLLPNPGPGRRYRVAAEGGQVIVDEVLALENDSSCREDWLKELERRRARGVTGKTGTPVQEIFDEMRGEGSLVRSPLPVARRKTGTTIHALDNSEIAEILDAEDAAPSGLRDGD